MSSRIQQSDSIEKALAQLSTAYDAECNKGSDANLDKLHTLACSYFALIMRQSNRQDQHHIQDLRDRIGDDVKAVQKTHNKWPSVAITIVSSVLSVGAGVTGVVGALKNIEKVMKVAKFGGSIGSGVGGLGRLFEDDAARKRTGCQHTLDERKRVRDENDGTVRQNDTRVKDALRDKKDADNARHQAFEATTR